MSLKNDNRFKFFNSIRFKLVLGYSTALLLSIIIISFYFYVQVSVKFSENAKKYLISELERTVQYCQQEALDQNDIALYLSEQTMSYEGPYRINYALFNSRGLLIARSLNFFGMDESIKSAQNVKVTQTSADEDPGTYKGVFLVAKAFRNPYERVFVSHFEQLQHQMSRNERNLSIIEYSIRDLKGYRVFLATKAFNARSGKLYYLQFGLDSSSYVDFSFAFFKTVLLAVPIVIFIAIIGGTILTRRVLEPVSRLTNAARQIADSGKYKDLPIIGTGDEIDNLAIAFNSLFQQLRNSYKRILSFTADASHELRLPITTIKGEAEVILDRERSLEEYQKALGSMIEEMDRLTKMINRLLSLSRADSGKEKLVLEELDLVEILQKLSEFFSALAESKGINLNFSSEPEVALLKADRMKLQELFSNLIENAIKYTDPGGSVTVSVKKAEDYYKIAISDTGIGIPEEQKEKIFERFYRVDKARSRDQGGAGLGLSIVNMIAKSHGGKITIDSVFNQGSTFNVFLPRSGAQN